jgi:hypothetical protein
MHAYTAWRRYTLPVEQVCCNSILTDAQLTLLRCSVVRQTLGERCQINDTYNTRNYTPYWHVKGCAAIRQRKADAKHCNLGRAPLACGSTKNRTSGGTVMAMTQRPAVRGGSGHARNKYGTKDVLWRHACRLRCPINGLQCLQQHAALLRSYWPTFVSTARSPRARDNRCDRCLQAALSSA